ncbi:MAG: heat-inducible transcriptional repressor HrcA [Christensenellales bacterium]|jgi:heat-inducible transcriptional repressor
MALLMDERKKRILRAIIDDHIQTAAPVGSRTISRKYGMGLSSATIRNEMSDLEELGYLEQPHISAGRVPNAKAYRLYVDFLLESGPSEDDVSQQARNYFLANIKQLEDIVASTAQILSEFTRYVSVVLMPRREALRIRSLHLLPISRASALLVIVTDGGIVRDTLVHVSDNLDAEALYAISRMLTERFRMKSLSEAQEILREYAAQSEADPRVLQGIMELAAQIDRQASSDNLQVSGSHNILNYPEYYDVDRARNLLSVLEEKERLTELMRNQAHQAYSVHIGPETGIHEMDCCSVIMASYQAGHGRNGSIGIIGPTRMPYATILSTLAAVGSALSDILSAENAPL